MLWSVHLPHDDGGGPVAFAGESSILTSVGVFPQQASCLRMRRAKKYLASFILLSEPKSSTHTRSKDKNKVVFAGKPQEFILLIDQHFADTFRLGCSNHVSTEHLFRQARSPPLEEETHPTNSTEAHQDLHY